ncbi:MAG: sugar ABC transporter ATP-binding protein [Lentisphaerae bacterium]|nr:sugar ABC transporter ATP-binding protein [Lentisphaerota bacterium]
MAQVNNPREPSAMPVFVMTGMTKRFGATTALDGVDFSVRPGEIRALIGENGAGKSTLVSILAGAGKHDEGTMVFDGRPYRPASPHDARKAGVAVIYQELSLADHMTVEENICLGMEPGRFGFVDTEAMRRRAQAALDQLGHRDMRTTQQVRHLSAAERQVVEIARALSTGCRVIVLDEPTSGLSGDDSRALFSVLRRLARQGCAVVYISHFLEEVTGLCHTFTALRDGRVAGSGKLDGVSVEDLAAMLVGRRSDAMLSRRTHGKPGDIVLTVDGLAAGKRLRLADLALRRGEILGIAGLLGSGRTELLRAIFALDPVVRGDVRVGAYSVGASPSEMLNHGVGLLSEDRKGEGLAAAMSVADNMTLSRLKGFGFAGFISSRSQNATTQKWIDALRIRCAGPLQNVHRLSGGNQQKVALARLLHHDVDVLLLDEPTRGIDVASKAEVYRLIASMAEGDPAGSRSPRSVLLVSSHFPELLAVCDRIAVMKRGELYPARAASEWTEHGLMMAATGQEAA